MGYISDNISKNISKLRKANNMTQLDLADKLNYSDKAISKWERGDSTPDIEMLDQIAKLFNVDIDYLTKEHSDFEINNTKNEGNIFIRNLIILIMICVSVLLVVTFIFVGCIIAKPENAKTCWIVFVSATPIISLICAIYAKKSKYWLMQLISFSLTMWLLITTAFCVTLIFNLQKFWLLYIAGVPIQAAICLYLFFKKTF